MEVARAASRSAFSSAFEGIAEGNKPVSLPAFVWMPEHIQDTALLDRQDNPLE